MAWNEAITSYNMLISVLYSLYLLSLGMGGMVSIKFHFIPEILGKNIGYQSQKYPDLDRIKIFIPDSTQKYS